MKYLFMLLLVSTSLLAQDSTTHRFWDKGNIALHTANAAVQTVDAITTQRNRVPGYDFKEHNPVVRPFVTRGWPGQVAYSYGLTCGWNLLTSYILHKTGHHRWERIVPTVSISFSAWGIHKSVTNYKLGTDR